jgi:hypothetical protein
VSKLLLTFQGKHRVVAAGRVAPIAPDSDWISLPLKIDCHEHINPDGLVAGTLRNNKGKSTGRKPPLNSDSRTSADARRAAFRLATATANGWFDTCPYR